MEQMGSECENDHDCNSDKCDMATGKCIQGEISAGSECVDEAECAGSLICGEINSMTGIGVCCSKGSCEGSGDCCKVLEENPGSGSDYWTSYVCKIDKCCIDRGDDCNVLKDSTCCDGNCDGWGDKGECKINN